MYYIGMVVGGCAVLTLAALLGIHGGIPANQINECRAANPGYDCSIEIRWVPSQPWSAPHD